MMKSLASIFTSLSTKAIVGGAIAVSAVGGGAVATHALLTANHGSSVHQAVVSCKSHETQGQHGIGKCVSSVAKTKGVAERNQHAAKGADNTSQGEAHAAKGKAHATANTVSDNPALPSHPASAQ